MAEQRKKSASILLYADGKIISVELFVASLWPKHSSVDGEYRIRIDGRWYSPEGKYTFVKFAAIGELVARLLEGKEEFQEETMPEFQKNQRVRVHMGECLESLPIYTLSGYVFAPPFRGVDGRWRAYVTTPDGTQAHLCHDIEAMPRKSA